MCSTRRYLLLVAGVGVLLFSALPALADWDLGDPYKWLQRPDLETTGVDVHVSGMHQAVDDFQCIESGPITGIHIWGSYKNDYMSASLDTLTFTLAIYDDIPAELSPNGYSTPGQKRWERTFESGEFVGRIYAENIEEGYYWPFEIPGSNYVFPGDTICVQYNFQIDPSEAFVQEGLAAAPKVYWLGVDARTLYGQQFGWKTSRDHWNDDAVSEYVGSTSWDELRYPQEHPWAGESMDLAFVIVPEPGTLVLLAMAGLGLLLFAWRRRK